MADKNNEFYSFYFLDEKKFMEECDKLSSNSKNGIKMISTVGKIKNYDTNSKLGEIIYESKILETNFQRVSHLIQLDQPGLFFFYGFLNYLNDKLQFVCEYISEKSVENFDRLEFQKYVIYKRNIIEKCNKIRDNKENNIWLKIIWK